MGFLFVKNFEFLEVPDLDFSALRAGDAEREQNGNFEVEGALIEGKRRGAYLRFTELCGGRGIERGRG